jgi:hypothetical protein
VSHYCDAYGEHIPCGHADPCCPPYDTVCRKEYDAALADRDRLAEIVEALPCKCGSYELPEHNALCPKSKAAAAKENT